ncbi:hypothetical protein EHQ12_11710 [Leptospira gomenensis]|uniref:Uncharacterized protein n=1 Tax=Leptospira gomenensis TaxID=2484974 RepID=A0A5F1YY44_9LEPT|nr:hypothetical protein [Leptospira gomenensis]TGK34960.1 hypothetical protein EHQ17_07985 [Leptospira gomenensis]TGK36756.1 hypothetical protein EHQ12_11710 [Leptospira gomenensis]TGK48839.1 hypothetical protein EHQ07_05725 [Leptospira gomenensis]TGK64605.1 hypothetical protein EHQ13_06900 [Leptospira gomenensis]
MIYALILTILCGFFFVLSYKEFQGPKKLSSLRPTFQNAFRFPLRRNSVFLLLSLFAWMLLPLFWGLAFFLKTDANVLIVIGFMIWTYYWLKYLLTSSESA